MIDDKKIIKELIESIVSGDSTSEEVANKILEAEELKDKQEDEK